MKGKLSKVRFMETTNTTAYVCKHTRVFRSFWEALSKRSFGLWENGIAVDVKCQKQLTSVAFKIFIEVFLK